MYNVYCITRIYKGRVERRVLWHADSRREVHSWDKVFSLPSRDWQWSSAAISLSPSLPPSIPAPTKPPPLFFASTSRTLNNTKVTGSPESILSKTLQTCSVLMCLFFLMTRYVSLIKGSSAEDSKGEERSTITHARTHTHTYTEYTGERMHTLSCLPEHLCVWKREQHKASLSLFLSFFLFHRHEMTHYCFCVVLLPCAFWSVPAEGWASWSSAWERPLDAELVITLLWKAFYWCAVLHARQLLQNTYVFFWGVSRT